MPRMSSGTKTRRVTCSVDAEVYDAIEAAVKKAGIYPTWFNNIAWVIGAKQMALMLDPEQYIKVVAGSHPALASELLRGMSGERSSE